MLYSEYISKAKNICILINETNNVAYLSPDYRYILYLAGMDLKDVTDFPDATMDIVGENLKLEVEAYNKRHENLHSFVDNLENFIASFVVPLLETDQNEIIDMFLKRAQDVMKVSNEKQTEIDTNSQDKNESIVKMQDYINFQKKKI